MDTHRNQSKTGIRRHGSFWLGLGLSGVVAMPSCIRLDTEGHCLAKGGDAWCRTRDSALCIAEFEGGERVVSAGGDGCFALTPPCVDAEQCVSAKYGLPRAVANAEIGVPAARARLDTVEGIAAALTEEGLIQEGCDVDLSMVDADAVTAVDAIRRRLTRASGTRAFSKILTREESADIERMNQSIDRQFGDCMVEPPIPCSDEATCTGTRPFCVDDFCQSCVVAKQEQGIDCEDGFSCNPATGACEEVCFLPEVSFEGLCVTCDQVPPADADGVGDPADEACAAAAVVEGAGTSVCDRDQRQCVECTEEKFDGCSDDQVCDPNSNRCVLRCVSSVECAGEEGLPYCSPAGWCVPCDQAEDPMSGDAACALVDSQLPVCVPELGECAECRSENKAFCGDASPACNDEGLCVECTGDDSSRCDGLSLVCQDEQCAPCAEHAQCGDAACNLFTGVCLPTDEGAVVNVGGPAADYESLEDAVAHFGPSAEGTIIVYDGNYNETVVVDGERVIAFLAAEVGEEVAPPRWIRSEGMSPQLTIGDAVVLIDGMQISGNASATPPGVRVDGGRAWVERSRVVDNRGGGILAVDGAELVVRSCFVGGDVNDTMSVVIDNASASIVYSSIGAGFGDSAALTCAGISTVDLRNSLLVSRAGLDEVQCPEVNASNSVAEQELGGTNLSLGDMETSWFLSYGTGDFHLAGDYPDVINSADQWQPGDPSTDIDGTPRPAVAGDVDVAGADIP